MEEKWRKSACIFPAQQQRKTRRRATRPIPSHPEHFEQRTFKSSSLLYLRSSLEINPSYHHSSNRKKKKYGH
jgi:predicted amidophosphoribosyltransferase